jgi:uncharacterized membrane protein
MKPKAFLQAVDRDAIVAAIGAAEKRSSGQVRVLVTHQKPRDILRYGRRAFAKLGMSRTVARNAVLIVLCPLSQKLAVIGDTAVHERCGPDFWREVVLVLEAGLRREAFTAALVQAIEKVGAVLAEHFPVQPGETNELPDDIVED